MVHLEAFCPRGFRQPGTACGHVARLHLIAILLKTQQNQPNSLLEHSLLQFPPVLQNNLLSPNHDK